MLKRTQGRLLLTLLVITGLAGTLNNNSLSLKERKSAMNLMKDTRTDLIKSVQGLSENQLNFKASPDCWSIKQYVYHATASEEKLWNLLKTAMHAPANPEKRADIRISDAQLIARMGNCNARSKSIELPDQTSEPKNISYKSVSAALESFKAQRADYIKYIKLSTEDLRNHVIKLPIGWLDCYQLCLLNALYSNLYMQQIDELKATPNFPKH